MNAHVLLNLFKLLGKCDKMLDKPHVLSLSFNWFNKFNNRGAQMLDLFLSYDVTSESEITPCM